MVRYGTVIAIVGMNPKKKYLVSPDERAEILRLMLQGNHETANIRVEGEARELDSVCHDCFLARLTLLNVCRHHKSFRVLFGVMPRSREPVSFSVESEAGTRMALKNAAYKSWIRGDHYSLDLHGLYQPCFWKETLTLVIFHQPWFETFAKKGGHPRKHFQSWFHCLWPTQLPNFILGKRIEDLYGGGVTVRMMCTCGSVRKSCISKTIHWHTGRGVWHWLQKVKEDDTSNGNTETPKVQW